jgi:hypothetical protein
VIVAGLTDGVLGLAYWSTSWGTNVFGAERIDIIQGYAPRPPLVDPALSGEGGAVATVSGTLDAGRGIIGLWNSFVKTIAAAFIYGLFWCFAAAIYLLLRHDVDESETDEIFIVEEKRTYELPPLKSDASGIPQVQSLVPVDERAVSDPETS